MHHMRNSEDFIHKLVTLWIQHNDILVSPDLSLFTSVSVGDTLNLLSQQFHEHNNRLLHHILTSSLFFFFLTDHFCEWSQHGLITVTCNFEEVALSRMAYNPTCLFHYAYDTFVI